MITEGDQAEGSTGHHGLSYEKSCHDIHGDTGNFYASVKFQLEIQKKSFFLNLDRDILTQICQYLLAVDLCQLSYLCSYTTHQEWQDILDSSWHSLTVLRWRVPDRIKKTIYCTNWKAVYRILDHRQMIPEGKFSGRQHVIFGKGSVQNSAMSWFMLNHGINAMIRESFYQGSMWRMIGCRLCVQNMFSSIIHIPISKKLLKLEAFSSEELVDGILPTADYKILSFNGATTGGFGEMPSYANNILSLSPLEFTVIEFKVYCPQSVTNEPDFLTMIKTVKVYYSQNESNTIKRSVIASHGGRLQQDLNSNVLNIKILSDQTIWGHYTTLQSGVVLLKERQYNNISAM